MFHHNSQRTNPKYKPKFPRLQTLFRKRGEEKLQDLDAYVDDHYLISFKTSNQRHN